MNTIKHIVIRYTAFLWALLKPLGAWGVFAIAALDGSLLGLPLDPVVASYVYTNRSRFLLYVFMASAGSVLGSIVIYIIGYTGGETLLRKRIPPERFAKIHAAFEKHPFWALMFPAMLPPPTPFKLFVLAAGVTEMQFSHFVLAIFAGRVIRFTAIALLTLKFGPEIVQITGTIFREHFNWVLAAVALGLAIWLGVRWWKAKSKAGAAEFAGSAEKK
ncbi:MAG TPA: VTT domain-containing protein [Terriglobales bacterium]|nr:VTT domain-containing protein [Terriglobales bacterium]